MEEGGGSALRSLLALFSIEVDDKGLKRGEEGIRGLLATAKEAGKALVEAFTVHEVVEFIQGQVEAAGQLKATASRIGTTTDELQAYELAAREAHVSVEALTVGLRFLNRNMGEASAGSAEAQKAFAGLHISLKDAHGAARPAAEVMSELADKVSGIQDPAEKARIAVHLLGRGGQELIPLLNKGGAAFVEARKQMEEFGGGVTDGFIEQAEAAEAAEAKLGVATTSLKTALASALLPGFTEIITVMREGAVWFKKTADGTHLVEVAMLVLGGFASVKAIGLITGLAKAFGLLRPSVLGTVRAFAGFLAPAIVIAALALVVEDLWTTMSGGKGVIANAIADFGEWAGVMKSNASNSMQLRESVYGLIDGLKAMGSVVWQFVVAPFEAAFDALKGMGKALGDLASGNFSGAAKDLAEGKGAGKADLYKRMHGASEAASDLGDMFSLSREGRAKKKADARLASGADVVAPAFRRPGAPAIYSPRGGGGGGQHGDGAPVINQKVDTKIEIVTSTSDPKAHADMVSKGVATAQQRAFARALTAYRKS